MSAPRRARRVGFSVIARWSGSVALSARRPFVGREAVAAATVPSPVVRLLEVEPDLGRDLDAEEWIAAGCLALGIRSITKDGTDVDELLANANAFGVVVIEGMLRRRIRIDGPAALRLLGPGDIYMQGAEPGNPLLAESSCRATSGTTLALLNNKILIATYRWPPLVAGLLRRIAEQAERISLQLAVGHLPRVEDRLLAMFELIADQWGYVTPHGRMVPLHLTHETLGGLVGARRSTVTLALHTLSHQGELLKHRNGWLLCHDVTASRSHAEKATGGKNRPVAVDRGHEQPAGDAARLPHPAED